MSLYIKSDTETGAVPVFQKIWDDIRGGVAFQDANIPSDIKEIGMGTLIATTDTDGLYDFVKTAKSNSTQTAATSIKLVPGGHLFVVGEFIMKETGATAATITVLTHTSASTDTIVTSVALGALATATKVVQAAASALGATTIDELNDPVGVLRNTIEVRECDLTTLYNVTAGVVTRASVIEGNLPNYVTASQKTALTSRVQFA